MVLLGRTAEQEAVARLLASARLGRGGALVVTGEPGIGKTALLSDAVERVRLAADMRVTTFTGSRAEQDLPFAALHAVLLPALALLDDIPEPQADALAAALLLRPGRTGRPGDRFAIGAATLSLLSRYAETAPVLVGLDDVQWVDRPSLDALAFAARRVHEDPVAVLLAGRVHELPAPVLDLPALELQALGDREAADLVAQVLPGPHPPEALARLYRAAGGNPLALLELAADPEGAGDVDLGVAPTVPDRLRAAFARRLSGLDGTARDVAVVAAVAGGDLRLTRAACVALALDADALARAQQAGVLAEGVSRVTFRHPVLRSILYADAAEELRRRVHLAVAGELGGTDEDRRAWHLAAAATGPDETVARLLDALAARAAGRTAYLVASTALERAARLTPDPEGARARLLGAAEAAWTGGAQDRALALLDETEPPGAAPSAEGLGLRATIAVRSGSVREGRDMLERAATLAGPEERVLLLAEACRACMYLIDLPALRRVEEHLSAALGDVDDPSARAVALAASGAAGVLLGTRSTARIRAAAPLLADHVDPVEQPAALPWLMLAPLFLRDADSGAELLRLVDDVRSRVGVGAMPNLLFHVGRDQATSSAWGRAAANFDEGVRLARETGQGAELAMLLAGTACLESRQGRAEDCRRHVAEAMQLCSARSIHFGELWCHHALGDLALSEGDAGAAAERLGLLLRRLEELEVGDPDLHPAPELVDALGRIGDTERAVAVARDFAAAAATKARPWALARAHRALGLVAADDALDAPFHAALEQHALTRDEFETARTRLAYGARLRRVGRRVDARPWLKQAIAAFDVLGAELWAGNARAELEATGETVPPREPAGPGALTPQELQVCLLLADGRTTREAAAALFLSPKTVEYHLRKAYTKLGIHSRPELAELLPALEG